MMSYPFLLAMQSLCFAVKLDVDYGLKAGKDVGDRCVNVRWNKVEGGACYVKYKVVLRNASGGYQYSDSGYNIGEMTMCSFATFSNVTDVQLTVSFKATSTNVTANVFDTPISTSTPTPPGMTPFYIFHSTYYVSCDSVQIKESLKYHTWRGFSTAQYF